MQLSSDLISQFVKITNDTSSDKQNESTVYGTVERIVKNGDDSVIYVHLDGASEVRTTPVSTTINVSTGNRVAVTIRNHSGVISENLSLVTATTDIVNASPSYSSGVDPDDDSILLFDSLYVPDTVTTTKVKAMVADVEALIANEATIETLKADKVTIHDLIEANVADINELKTNKLDVDTATITYATIDKLNSAEADINKLKTNKLDVETAAITYATIDKLNSAEANISELKTNKLDAETAAVTYANIDFTNIGNAAMEYLYSKSGLIESVVVNDGSITGMLVGVTIKGDMIEANTLVADKLVIQGEDGLYYNLNTDGLTTETEQTEYNSLNGSVITAKSITAEKVNVSDLVAFDATIGGFNITDNAIFSEVKDDEGNTTRGIYMDIDGQINFGDETNFIKYYKDDEGNYKLAISAESIMYLLNDTQHDLSDIGLIGEYVKISTYEDEPCIELGEQDSDFKLRITNTRILFMEGTNVPAYINNQSLYINKAVIEEELQQGEFVWKIRSNGNLGLMWRGVSD